MAVPFGPKENEWAWELKIAKIDPVKIVELDTCRDFTHCISKTRIHRDDQREGRKDFLCHLVGRILRVVVRTVHLTLLLNVNLVEHDLLNILGLGSALCERARA